MVGSSLIILSLISSSSLFCLTFNLSASLRSSFTNSRRSSCFIFPSSSSFQRYFSYLRLLNLVIFDSSFFLLSWSCSWEMLSDRWVRPTDVIFSDISCITVESERKSSPCTCLRTSNSSVFLLISSRRSPSWLTESLQFFLFFSSSLRTSTDKCCFSWIS